MYKLYIILFSNHRPPIGHPLLIQLRLMVSMKLWYAFMLISFYGIIDGIHKHAYTDIDHVLIWFHCLKCDGLKPIASRDIHNVIHHQIQFIFVFVSFFLSVATQTHFSTLLQWWCKHSSGNGIVDFGFSSIHLLLLLISGWLKVTRNPPGMCLQPAFIHCDIIL